MSAIVADYMPSATPGKRTNVGETLFARRQQVFWEVGFLFFSSSSSASRQNSATAESGFIYFILFLLEPRPRTAVDRVGGLKYLVVDSRTFGVLYHMRGGLRHETFITRRNSAQFSFFFFVKLQ